MSRRQSGSHLNSSNTPTSRHERIPSLLQSVFLQSNRGKDVHKPPPERMANKVFFRNWMFRRGANSERRIKKSYDSTKDKLLTKSDHVRKTDQIAATAESSQTQQPKPPPAPKQVEYTLEEYFNALLEERGYKVTLYETMKTGYYHAATNLQVSSYGPRMVQIVRSSDAPALRETMAGGLSPNPCNQFGESLLHMICRRGDAALLEVMVEAGTCLQVSDDQGRTPLHDAFWAAKPAFDVVKRLLDRDAGMMFLQDKRGHLPLSYVQRGDWPAWCEWLDAHIDEYFPESKAESYEGPELAKLGPNSIALLEEKASFPLELIRMIANGDLSPQEARAVAEQQAVAEVDPTEVDDESDDESLDHDDDDGHDSDDDHSDYDSDDDYSHSDEDDFDDMAEAEIMMEMLHLAKYAKSSTKSG